MINFAANLNILRKDPNNVGDFWASPVTYFDFLKGTVHVDPQRDYSLNNYALANKSGRKHVQILGGGGVFIFNEIPLINESKKINPLTKLVCWGAGHNRHNVIKIQPDDGLPDYLKNWDLVGVRDYNQGYEWVPCVSCMHPAFDKKYEAKYKVVVYEHKDYRVSDHITRNGYPRMTNAGNDIEKVINFLGSAELVITSTYHGVYWSTLLNKKVIIVNPFSSKFSALKHEHPMPKFPEEWENYIDETKSYPSALSECR